jgi:hypothetical protein
MNLEENIKGHPTNQQSSDFDFFTAVMIHHEGHSEDDLQIGFIGRPPVHFGNPINGMQTLATIITYEKQWIAGEADFYHKAHSNVPLLTEKTDKVKDRYFFLCKYHKL